MSKVSIITTTYNHQSFIEETIESILLQTFDDWELLIGDDSPNNSTWHIIQKYVKKYPNKIKAWHHYPNKGIVDNMNFLIKKISNNSKYIAFLEGDDVYMPNNLEEKIKIFKKYPEVGMVYNNVDVINENGKIIEKNLFNLFSKILKNEKLDINNFIIGTFYCSYSTMMLNIKNVKNIKIKNPKKDIFYLNSDYIFFADIGTNYNLYGIKKILTKYRKHKGNNSKKSVKLAKDILVSIMYLNKKYQLKKNIFYFKYYSLNSYISFLEKKRNKAIKYGFISFFYNFKKNAINRIGLIFLSVIPSSIGSKIFNIYRKKRGKGTI